MNYFCPVSENRWHQCSQNSCCNGELECIVYLCCCFLSVNWGRSYSFRVHIFLWNLPYRTEDLPALQRFCYQGAVLSQELPAQCGAAPFCSLGHRLGAAAGPGSPFRDRCQPWELCLPFPSLHASASLRSVSLIYGETQKQIQDGKGNRKEKNYRVGGGRGEVAKEREMKTERQRKNCFPFYEEREPSNQDDWVQLLRPLYTHELAIKCGSSKQKTS